MKELMKKMLEEGKVWAVVGATAKKDRYGYKIMKMLRRNGFKVYPVNPGYDEIDSEKCYHVIADIPEKVDCISMVVPPSASKEVIKTLTDELLWLQPGSFDGAVLAQATKQKLETVSGECVLVQLKHKFL